MIKINFLLNMQEVGLRYGLFKNEFNYKKLFFVSMVSFQNFPDYFFFILNFNS